MDPSHRDPGHREPGRICHAITGSDIAGGDEGDADPLSCSKASRSGATRIAADGSEFDPTAGGDIEVDIVHDCADWVTDARLGNLNLANLIETAIRHACVCAGEMGPAEICVSLADDAAVKSLNARFRQIDKPTNVLSFPAPDMPMLLPDMPRPLGDLVLAYETTAAEAAAMAIELPHHIVHLVVHGTLHLLGHDHQDEAEATIMETLEIRILAGLGIADPYLNQELENTPAVQAGG